MAANPFKASGANQIPPDLRETLHTMVRVGGFEQYELALTNLCENVRQFEHEGNSDNGIVALQSAVLAKVLIERLRNPVGFDQAARQRFLTKYHSLCAPLLLKAGIAKIKPESPQSNESVLNDVQALIGLAMSSIKNSSEKTFRSYIYGVQWLYDNSLDKHGDAEQAARKAIETYQVDQDKIVLAEKHTFLGTSLLQLGRFNEGISHMRNALVIAVNAGVEEKYVGVYSGLAFAYLRTGDYASAKRYFKVIIELQAKQRAAVSPQLSFCNGYSMVATKALVQLGKIQSLDGNNLDALDKLQCAIGLLKDQSDYYYYVALLEKAKVQATLGKLNDAKNTAQQLLVMPHIMQVHKLQTSLLLLSIGIGKSPPYMDKTLEQQVTKMAGVSSDKTRYPIEFIAFTRLKMAYAALVNDQQAFNQNAEQGFVAIEQIKWKLNNKDTWLAAQYAFVDEFVNAAYDSKTLSPNATFSTIINVLDSHYSLSYFDGHQRTPFGDELKTLPKKSKRLFHNHLKAEHSLINSPEDQKTQLQHQLDKTKEALLAQQYENKPESDLEFSSELTAHSMQEVQARLAKDEVLVRYFISDRRSLAFVITAKKVYIHELPEAEQLRLWVSSIEAAAENEHMVSKMTNVELSRLLPISAILANKYKKLIIIPDDVLHRLPFSALNVSGHTKRYKPLAEHLEVVRTHSIHDYLFGEIVSKSSQKRNNKITVFADPTFTRQSKLLRLPNTKKEANKISDLFGKKQVSVYLGEAVTNQALMNELARQSKILHIATHGYYDPLTPDVVGIATSPGKSSDGTGGFLSLTQLLSKPFYSDLVVISGCETMLGEYYKGSGMKSLTRGLLMQGAGSVLGSLWKITDRSTATFMGYFYEALKQSKGDSSYALYKAKLDLSKHQGGRYRDPYYWAGFVLTSVSQQYEQINLN